ncbi:unnamed protein product [Clonostachys byssicola]|uniref:Heterokaryon incompatibility domain-containing protein n=1 Tax=Clonostachys byssicola TaxID=160290 RepID=A0A9N9UAV5_9HYPO|nr:unnamed protein product [Clonostachys byssicola]
MFAASEENPPAETQIILGSFEEAISTECLRHKPLVEWFVDFCGPKDEESEEQRWELGDVGDLGFVFKNGNVEIYQSVSQLGYVFDLALVSKSPSHPDPIRKARIVDPMYIDLDLVKHWKNECLTSHGTTCQNSMKIWHTRPAWLVDVKQMCVVPGDDPAVGSSFIALSYHQGSSPGVSVIPELMLDLQRPGVLDEDEAGSWVSQLMTPIIRHAIYLTSTLDERYIWVDALCIVHGDGTTTDQLGLMGAIYASATVVIIAADGDAQDGISGLRGISQSCPREFEQHSFPFEDEETIVARHLQRIGFFGGLYFNRGWTFQEYWMASRKILFHGGLAHWECQCSQWHEDLAHLEQLCTFINPWLRDILAGFPNLGLLGSIINRYNQRELRYEEDALPGITGLLSVLSRSYTGGFLYGIPETFFDRAIGWTVPSWEMVRRVSSDRPNHLKFAAGLPSWSWVGWQGDVDVGEEAQRINHRKTFITETIPITQWYTGDSPTTPPQARRRIRSSWYDQRDTWKKRAAELASPLPDGWTRYEVKPGDKLEFDKREFDEPLLWPEGCGGYVYKHENLRGADWGPTDAFFYPFPVPKITESTPPEMPKQTAYLFCTTQRVRLWTRGQKIETKHGENTNCIYLDDEVGGRVGTLRLHNEDQLEWLEAESAGTERGVQLELVAINRVLTWAKTFSEQLQRYAPPRWTKDERTVLWIEWENGVAYRKAAGRIGKSHWENLHLEDVELVLG